MLTSPHTTTQPPTYIFLLGEYVATLEFLEGQNIPYFIKEQVKNRCQALKNLMATDLVPERITQGIPVPPPDGGAGFTLLMTSDRMPMMETEFYTLVRKL